jgi:hypothetical protein
MMVLEVNSMVSQVPWQEHSYRNTRHMYKLQGDKELDSGMYAIWLRILH